MFRTPDPGIAGILPRETDVPGWERIQESFRVDRTDFSAFHESYALYDLAERAIATYRSYRSGYQITAEIVRCGSLLDAFGIMSWERECVPDYRKVSDTVHVSPLALVACEGVYFIRIYSTEPVDGLKEDLLAFLNSINQNLHQKAVNKSLPSYMTLFSPDYSLDSLLFLRKGMDELPGMPAVFIRRRTIFDREARVFFHRAENEDASERMFNNLTSRVNKFLLSRAGDYPVASREMEPGRVISVSHNGIWIFGVLNAGSTDEGSRITGMLYREIRDFR